MSGLTIVWPGLIISMVLLIMGVSLALEGKHQFNQWMGCIIVLVAGAVLGVSTVHPTFRLDHEKCITYMYSESAQEWSCVPREEAE